MSDLERIAVIRRTVEDCITHSRTSCTWGHEADIKFLLDKLDEMTREFELLRDCFTQACQISGERRGRIAELEAALREFETFAMIVEPRSHKAEWLTMLTRFRELLNARYATETPPKYGTCPVCGGMGGAHDATCRHSPAFEAETFGESK